MQLGFQAIGTKEDVLASIQAQASKEQAKFTRNCKEHQIAIYGPGGHVASHKPAAISDSTSSSLTSAALSFVSQHLSHCKPEDEVSVSFSMTVSRPNPS